MARIRAYTASSTHRGDEKRRQEARGNATIGAFSGFLVAFFIGMVIAPGDPLSHVFEGGIGAGIGYFVTLGWLLHRLVAEQPETRKRPR